MGYHTYYTLEHDATDEERKGHVHEAILGGALSEAFDYTGLVTAPPRNLYKGNVDEARWYEHEKDMRAFSVRFPEILFTLRGIGEDHTHERPDIWIKYFKAGKMQEARIQPVFDAFSEAKLR